ncbi:uncharacterized protein DUF4184 [Mucilaginibacter gracilis]|uniref:Uncharacterized protein DUF4184 n=1 Tax=Mucilaginibacter gracilis TaxID=423350 RepID=A0A495J355_9SPHI|nr:DUF4184 family protein [Mucilaginibacter gracilis]RKR83111.1 uncharacterized protein DUF4184 [Mucilaginibacter gracilis]
MPLTFSHPAIVLPLSYLPKRWVSLTGLIAGSVAPDFEYFFRMKVESIYSHTWLGLLWFDLPVSLMLVFIYHDVVKAQFIANLPVALTSRFSQYISFNWNKYFIKNIPVVTLSIMVGCASHLFWDSFTHASGYFVILWNMSTPVSLFSVQLPLYKIIQHLSTLLGGLVIIAAIYKMPTGNLRLKSNKAFYWLTVIGVTCTVIVFRIWLSLNIHQYWNVLVTAISASIAGVVLASVLVNRFDNFLKVVKS